MKENWIEALGKMTYGIYVLTTFYKDEINGMIASWVTQVSYDPFLIMIGIHPNRYSHRLIEKSGFFALHILSKTQNDLLRQFKGPDPKAKFSPIGWARGKTNCPILNECVAYMECNVKTSYSPGNHTLFIGEVVDAKIFSKEETLCTFDYPGIYIGDN